MTIAEAIASVVRMDEGPSHIFRVPVDYGSPGGYLLTLTHDADSPIGVFVDDQLVGVHTWPDADARAIVVDEPLAERAGFFDEDRGEDAIAAFAHSAIAAWNELYVLAVPLEELQRRGVT